MRSRPTDPKAGKPERTARRSCNPKDRSPRHCLPRDRARPRADHSARPTRRTPVCLIPPVWTGSHSSKPERAPTLANEDTGPHRLSAASPSPATF